jgi:site-specific recombinase XerD
MMLYDPNLGNLSIDAINLEWLRGFESSLVPLCPTANARAIHMRNIRAVFNYAIDMEKTTAYPFRKFKIKTEKTRKRALTAEQMHTLVTYPCTPAQEKYRDIFVLSFMLCGINIVDLVNLKEIVNGRIEYKRHKTGRLYSIKVHSEAMKIIEKYRGEAWLLDILDRNKNYKNYAKRLNEALRHIGPWERTSRGGKIIYTPLYPQITSYWARHTWASIASRLEIPKETIAHALGHGEDTVTDIYIDFDQRKVDEANQRVIDYVIRGGGET